MGIGGFGQFMGALFPDLRDVWNIPPRDGNAVGSAWERKIAAGDGISDRTMKFLNALPTLAAAGVTAIVLMPRIAYTIQTLRGRRGAKGSRSIDPFRSMAPPQAPSGGGPDPELRVDEEALRRESERRNPVIPNDSDLTGSGYAGEQADEFSELDGSLMQG